MLFTNPQPLSFPCPKRFFCHYFTIYLSNVTQTWTETERHTAHSLLALLLEFLYHNPSIPVFIRQRLQIFPRAHSILDSILLLTGLSCFPSFSRLWHTDHAPASGFHVHADMYHPILIVLFAPCLFPLRLLLKLNKVIQKTTLREKDPCTSLSLTKPPLHPPLGFNLMDLDEHLTSEPHSLFSFDLVYSFSDLIPQVPIHTAKTSYHQSVSMCTQKALLVYTKACALIHTRPWSITFFPSYCPGKITRRYLLKCATYVKPLAIHVSGCLRLATHRLHPVPFSSIL